ncbi:Acyl-CoA oxidase, C-terminal [Dillenia turbinata]|uniref:Acyl-CoA oxidase, C-terminal n=1 Tax=Dillenia turbinata TaxID=194707 RepID=A0AAN8W9C8_9MAGN
MEEGDYLVRGKEQSSIVWAGSHHAFQVSDRISRLAAKEEANELWRSVDEPSFADLHGGLEATETFDPETDEFDVNSPTVTASKSYYFQSFKFLGEGKVVQSNALRQLVYGTMVTVRKNAVSGASTALSRAVCIATRYSAVRRQFGFQNGGRLTQDGVEECRNRCGGHGPRNFSNFKFYTDHFLGSVLGGYDGNVYPRLYEAAWKDPLNESVGPDGYHEHIRPSLKQQFRNARL